MSRLLRSLFNNKGYLAVSIALALGLVLLSLYILGVRFTPWAFMPWTPIWHPMCPDECLDIIVNDSYIDASRGMLVLHLSNRGGIATCIYRVELDETVVATYDLKQHIVLKPGERTTLTLRLDGIEIKYNRTYRLKIYTRAGNLYTANVTPR